MKKITRFKKITSSLVIGLLASGILVLAPLKASALTIPYQGEATPNAPSPAFNVYTGTPHEGNEPDFLRGKVDGDTNPSTDVVNNPCEDGTRFKLRVYVHNGASASQNDNGNGPSVAHDTMVRVGNVVDQTGTSFEPNATITASNAATVSDDMTINCTNGKTVTLDYVEGTAQQYSLLSGTKPVNDSIVTTGAPVGTMAADGNVWGCWDQRVYVTLIVEVKEKPTPPPVSKGECKVLEVNHLNGRRIEASVTGTTKNAQIIGYEIDFGDGTKVNERSAQHEYAQDGTYTITGRVHVEYANGTKAWKGGDKCASQITFKPDVPPTPTPVPPTPVTPTTLPDTGPGEIAAIFTAVSIAAGVAYRVYVARRLGA